jgi:fibronectin type 3 domain-containing protein
VTNATGYVVYRSTTSGGPFDFPANFANDMVETSYADKGLTTATTYYYQVRAVNSAGVSSPASVTVKTQ